MEKKEKRKGNKMQSKKEKLKKKEVLKPDWKKIWNQLDGDDERISIEIDKKLETLENIANEKIKHFNFYYSI